MIPPVHQAAHQGLHILALGQRAPAEAAPDAAGFLAALAGEQDSTSAPDAALNADATLSAEACVAAGLVTPALPLLNARPTAPIPPVPLTEMTSAEPAAMAPGAATVALAAGPLLALPQDALPQTETSVAIPPANPLQPDRTLADAAAHPTASREIPPAARNTDLVAPPATLSPTPTASPAAVIPVPHIASPDIEPQTPLQPAEPAATASQMAMLHTLQRPKAGIPLLDTQPQSLPNHTRQDHMAAQQSLPAQPLPIQPVPVQSMTVPPLPEHTAPTQNQHADTAVAPQLPKTRVSAAESAWQTRVQHAAPLAPAEHVPAPVEISAEAITSAPPNPPASTATGSENTISIDKKPPAPSTSPMPTAQILPGDPPAETALSQGPTAQPPQDHPRTVLASAPRTPDPAEKPTRDTSTPASATVTPPDQTLPQLVAGPAPPQANLAPVQPIQPQPTAQTAPPLPSLATVVPAQLLPHHAAAKTGGVDVLLQPEELGHVKFHIQQHGETVRILLSAERPETLDLLRRHSDQLLQEFRQSGFSQATLNFGQWGQQQRSPSPPAELAALFDADAAEAVSTPRPAAPTPAAPSGQGLNLRL